MRFLIHSSDSTYDATTKKFTVTLDKRVSNPSQLSVVGASFGASTEASYPLVVYLRSDWAQKLARTKHTVELKGNDHENPSNVLGVLRRHNSDSKFVLDRPFRFPIHGHTVERVVDFYFTDGASKLNGVYTPVEVPGTTDAMMEAHVTAGDIVVWIDLSKDGNVLNNSDDQAAIDDSVSKIISRTPGGSLQMSPNGVDKVKFVALGEANAVTGQASSGSISGNIAGVDDLDEGNHFFLFKSPADASGCALAIGILTCIRVGRHYPIQG